MEDLGSFFDRIKGPCAQEGHDKIIGAQKLGTHEIRRVLEDMSIDCGLVPNQPKPFGAEYSRVSEVGIFVLNRPGDHFEKSYAHLVVFTKDCTKSTLLDNVDTEIERGRMTYGSRG